MHLYEWADRDGLNIYSERGLRGVAWRCWIEDQEGTPHGQAGTGPSHEAALVNLAERNRGERFPIHGSLYSCLAPQNLFYASHDIS